ncbi:MAG: serine hydroxymethyltransferase, partial [Gemmatimonadota bacterium]
RYAAQVIANARALADACQARGYRVVTGGTDSHLFLLDLRTTPLTGKAAEEVLGAAGITVNKNTVPGESRSPFITSGVRIGTPAVTTRGLAEPDMARIGGWIADVLDGAGDRTVQQRIREDVRELCAAFPLYAGWRAREDRPVPMA